MVFGGFISKTSFQWIINSSGFAPRSGVISIPEFQLYIEFMNEFFQGEWIFMTENTKKNKEVVEKSHRS